MDSKHYDVIVIGSGIAGQTAAKICAENQLSVAILEKNEFGGVCALRGCDPKKVMMQFGELNKKCQQLQSLGISALPKIDWQQILDFKNQFTDNVPKNTKENLNEKGIATIVGSPKFLDENTISVTGKKLSANYFVLASGLTPRKLGVEGEVFVKTSADFFSLFEIPKSVTFIGSGYIGMEFAFLLNSLGSEVTVIEKGEQILSQFDTFLTEKLRNALQKDGIHFIFNATTKAIKKNRSDLFLIYEKEEKEHQITSTIIFNTTGRVPTSENLEIKKANIKHDETGIIVNDFLQSISNPNVYACGDISSKSLPLTPLSSLQGHIVGHNIIKENLKKFKNPLVPSVVFTHPNLAKVGLSEKEAKKEYQNIKIYKGEGTDWYNAKKENAAVYAYKIIVNKDSDEIIGASLLNTEANEIINLLSLAMNQKVKVSDLKKQIFTYPSFSYDIKKMFKKED